MKKILLLTLLSLLSLGAQAQRRGVERLFQEYASVEGATNITLNNVPDEASRMLGEGAKVDYLEVLSFGNVAESLRERVSRAIGDFNDARFETWISGASGGSRFRLLVRMNGEVVREVLVLVSGQTPVLIRLQGELNRSHLENLHKIAMN